MRRGFRRELTPFARRTRGAVTGGAVHISRPAGSGARYARILGVGGYLPRRIVTNEEICRNLQSSDEWIRQRTGIRTRRFAGPDETTAMMAAAAAGKALAQAGLTTDDADCLIAASMSHLYQAPPLASVVAGLLGSGPAAAFDVSAACAGFCYSLAIANDLVSAGSAKHVVVVGTERMSDITDPTDRSTAFIFGDGAGAAVVGPADQPGIGPVIWGSDPAGVHCIEQRTSWKEIGDTAEDTWPYLRMAGPQVYRWVVTRMPRTAQQALAAAGVQAEDLAAFIPHQANLRISEALAKALNLPPHVRMSRDVIDIGNTSAASIPLAMERMLTSGEMPSGAPALLIGFGSGLGYAAQVATLP
jgi:3-oxoacyl-[acyl-carrier-protein] synthase III